MSTKSSTYAEEPTEMRLVKYYKDSVPFYLPTIGSSYLAIRFEWFSELIEDELWKVYKCHIGKVSYE